MESLKGGPHLGAGRGLVLCLAIIISTAWLPRAAAETIREHFRSDKAFPMYIVVFGMLTDRDGGIRTVRVARVLDCRAEGEPEELDIEVPAAYIENAREQLFRKQYTPTLESEESEEVFTYFLYSPLFPASVITDLEADFETLSQPGGPERTGTAGP